MQVGKITCGYSPNFQRRLKDSEKMEYKHDAIRQAYEFLGVKDVALVMHGTCFPVTKNDLGVGSPINSISKDVIEMEMLHGFTSNQLGPLGAITRKDISPYASTVRAKNKLFIDINELATDKYSNILDNNLIERYAVKYKDKNSMDTYSKFYEAFENYDILLDKAYENFKMKVRLKEPAAIKLNEEFEKFKARNGQKVMKEALFVILSKIYGTEDFYQWESETDRNLISLLDDRNLAAKERYYYLMSRNARDANLYCFIQFLIDKQMNEHKQYRENLGFKYNADILIGTSKMEEYIYRDAFLKDFRMGCPTGGHYGPQLWDFPVPDPKKLFNPDGTLGEAGRFIDEKLEVALKDCENVRIDHVFGLVNPYVYDKNSVEVSSGQLDWMKYKGDFISNRKDLDPDGAYSKVLERIVIPALERHGVEPCDAVFEDIGYRPPNFYSLYYDKLKMTGIYEIAYRRGEDIIKAQERGGEPYIRKNWSYIGAHDSLPVQKLISDCNIKNDYAWMPAYLRGVLNPDPKRAAEAKEFEDKITNNTSALISAKFADLFLLTDKIQISFSDFFGLNKVYNWGGQKDKNFWKLRLNSNFEDAYYKNLSSDNPTALNIPEILKIAVRAKMDWQIVEKMHKNPDEAEHFRNTLNARMQPLLERLDKFAKILKEKE